MKKAIILILAVMIYSEGIKSQTKHYAVTDSTKLSWLGEKVLGQHTGTILLKSGWLDWNDNRITGGEFIIDMTTIKDDGGNETLERHLKSDDFFGVEKSPTARIVLKESSSFEKGTGTVKGELTIKGVTNPIVFRATLQKDDEGMWFFANIVVDRSKYNVRYGSGSFFENLGDKTIYDEFKLKVSLLVK